MNRRRTRRLEGVVCATLLSVAGARPLLSQTADPAPKETTAEESPSPAGAGVSAAGGGQERLSQENPLPPTVSEKPLGDLGFRFHGYLRSGYGIDDTGQGQQPFQAPLAGSKYRLGNEAETYLETVLAYGAVTEGDRPAYFDTVVRLAYVTPTSQTSNFDTTFSLREAYALARGIWRAKPEATFWAGARFYDRHDVHISDFYYRDPSGFGGGVEDVTLGAHARLAVAWIGGSQDELTSNGLPRTDPFRFNKNTFDIRLYGLPLGRASATLAIDLSQFNGDDDDATDPPVVIDDSFGASASAMLEWPFRGGRYKGALQYGKGAAYDFRSTVTRPTGRTFAAGEEVDPDDLWQFRILNDLLLDQRGGWALQFLAMYQELENGAASDGRVKWFSVGARPVRRLGSFASIALEVGWDHTEQGDLPGGSLVKVTIAPQITPTFKFLNRPSLRAFATWAHWSEDFRGSVAPLTDPDATHGYAVGVQMETWW